MCKCSALVPLIPVYRLVHTLYCVFVQYVCVCVCVCVQLALKFAHSMDFLAVLVLKWVLSSCTNLLSSYMSSTNINHTHLPLTVHTSNSLHTPPTHCTHLPLTVHTSHSLHTPPTHCTHLPLSAHTSHSLYTPPTHCTHLPLTVHTSCLSLRVVSQKGHFCSCVKVNYSCYACVHA